MTATRITAANKDHLRHLLTGKKIAIFAATMDPPTIGHDDILTQIGGLTTDDNQHVYDYSYIHIAENSPTGHYKSGTSPYPIRHAMTNAAFGGKARILLSDLPPLDTVSWLMQIPHLHVTHVLGADSLEWLQTVSDHGEIVFFTGHSADGLKKSHPTATVTESKTGEKILFSGDTLFQGAIGSICLPTSEPHRMRQSLERLAFLPPDTKVFPGHGPSTTIGAEGRFLKRDRK